MRFYISFVLFFVLLSQARSNEVDFVSDIRPILSDKCFSCHGPDEKHRKGKLRLDVEEGALGKREDGTWAFKAKSLSESEAWYRIITDDADDIMPPEDFNKPLSKKEKLLIKSWVESGAKWSDHWSFVKPLKKEVKGFEKESPIDRYVISKLRSNNLKMSKLADKRTLIRRVTFDITGLPPTMEEVNSFLNDKSPKAYEKLVDELLSRDSYGERMASLWLDAARYGDTSVMHADGYRTMWPWRDWVVKAFNENKPYDEFSIEQIAGDLIKGATTDQKIASAFNRNHPTTDEGGIIVEEARVGYVIDRVQTTSNVWLGLTMECAQCHDHKYDPISQEDYFKFYAFFNNHADSGKQTRYRNSEPISYREYDQSSDKLVYDKRIKDAENKFNKYKINSLRSMPKLKGDDKTYTKFNERLNKLSYYFPFESNSSKLSIDFIKDKSLLDKNKVSVKGKYGKGISYDGKNNISYSDSFKDLNLNNSFTFTFWLNPKHITEKENKIKSSKPKEKSKNFYFDSRVEGRKAIISSSNADETYYGGRGYEIGIQDDKIYIHLYDNLRDKKYWKSKEYFVLSNSKIPKNKWTHISIVHNANKYKNKNLDLDIYINGSLSSKKKIHKDYVKNIGSLDNRKSMIAVGGRSMALKDKTPNLAKFKLIPEYKGLLDELSFYELALSSDQIKNSLNYLLEEAKTKVSNNELDAKNGFSLKKRIQEYEYLTSKVSGFSDKLEAFITEINNVNNLIDEYKSTNVMIMGDLPKNKMRKTYILEGGQYDSPDKNREVFPSPPKVFLKDKKEEKFDNRLSLAKWIFDNNNPLTSRVAVNWIWQMIFGEGLVNTPSDFGAQGSFPTHPKLLDWLAVDFVENGWNIKNLLKKMLMTKTYRMSSKVSPKSLNKDPSNVLLSRAHRNRLTSEMIRDNALSLSGLLINKMGGPGVKIYQPPGLWAEVGLDGKPIFKQDKGEDKLHRRSLYTFWKRSAPQPALYTFDSPSREVCTLKRQLTNTPLQALASLNDVQIIEASRFMGHRILTEGGDSVEDKIRWGFLLATARIPNKTELELLYNIYKISNDEFNYVPNKANSLLRIGDKPLVKNQKYSKIDLAVWTMVSNSILNLDEVLTRN